MTVAELPTWLDLDVLRTGSVLVATGATILALAAMISIREVATRLVAFAVLAAIAVGAGAYRVDLEDCEPTCNCRFLGDPVESDDCAAGDLRRAG